MSKYCGKCDLYDCIYMRDTPIEEQLSKAKIYIKDELLNIKTETDLALFFPYIIGTSYSNKEGYQVIHLSKTDYIRETELNRISYYVRDAKREKQKCKRNKLDYIVEDVYKTRFSWMRPNVDKEQVLEIIRRVGVGGRQSYDDIRLPSCEWYRNTWYEDLVNKYQIDKELARRWVWHL